MPACMPNGHNICITAANQFIHNLAATYMYVRVYVCMYGVYIYAAAPLFMHVSRTPAIHSNRQLNMTISMGGTRSQTHTTQTTAFQLQLIGSHSRCDQPMEDVSVWPLIAKVYIYTHCFYY